MFFDDVVCNHIVLETMRYAGQKGAHDFEFSVVDFKVFIAVLIISGYVTIPSRRLYWSVGSDTKNEAISNAISRNDFEKILRFLHLADNDNLKQGDKFAKVAPLFDLLNEHF